MKKLTSIISVLLVCLIFSGFVSAEDKKIYIENFNIHSPEKGDEYLVPGIDAILRTGISSLDGTTVVTDSNSAELFISGNIIIIGKSFITTASLKNKSGQLVGFNKKGTDKSEILDHVNEFLGMCKKEIGSAKPAAAAPVIQQTFTRETPKENIYNKTNGDLLYISDLFREEIKGLVASDLNNDNSPEISWITENGLYIGKFINNELELKSSFKFQTDLKPLSIETINNILIVNTRNTTRHRFKAMAFEVSSNYKPTPKNIPDNYLYKSMYNEDGSHEIIAKQGGIGQDLFYGDIKILKMEGSKFKFEKSDLNFNFETLPSFAKGRFTQNQSSEIAVMESDRLKIFSSYNENIWLSDEKYGGSVEYIELPSLSNDDPNSRFYLSPRLISFPVENSKNMLLTIQNIDAGRRIFQRLRIFKNGYVKGLSRNRISFDEVYESSRVKGWVSDFALCDINNDNKKEIIIANPQKFGGFNSKTKSKIIILKFQ